MLLIIKIVLSLTISYLIGSIPTAYLFGRFLKGIDIRNFGSGNIGATNAARVLGKKAGFFVLIIDVLKGFLPVVLLIDSLGLNNFRLGIFSEGSLRIFVSLAVVIGHNWTIFLGFKGGKGVATTLGVLTGLGTKIPSLGLVLTIEFFIWLLIFLSTSFISLSSIITAFFLPLLILIFRQPKEIFFLGLALCIFTIWRHKSNIIRLVRKEESKVNLFSRPRKSPPES